MVASGTLAALGGVIALLFPVPAPVAVGFVLLGLGLAGLFPVVLSHVGHQHRTNTGQAIAAVSTVGYLGGSVQEVRVVPLEADRPDETITQRVRDRTLR